MISAGAGACAAPDIEAARRLFWVNWHNLDSGQFWNQVERPVAADPAKGLPQGVLQIIREGRDTWHSASRYRVRFFSGGTDPLVEAELFCGVLHVDSSTRSEAIDILKAAISITTLPAAGIPIEKPWLASPY